MNLSIPDVRVGEPQMCGGVAVFPLFTGLPLFPGNSSEYILASEAMAKGTLTIQEVSEEGSVGDLLADNVGDQPVFILEGEEVRGAKQNRVLLHPSWLLATSRIRIPVCLRRARKVDVFVTGSSVLARAARRSFGTPEARERHWPDVMAVRKRMAGNPTKHTATATCSEGENMSDTLEVHREAVEDLRCSCGIPRRIGNRRHDWRQIVGIDLFDQPATCKVCGIVCWKELLLDALESCDTERQPDGNDISVKLYKAKVMRWQKIEPVVGLGESYQARGNDDTLATALVLNDSIVHLSMSMPSIS